MRSALGGVLLGLASTCAAESIDEFAYALRVDTPTGDALYRVSLPQSVYEGIARADLGDVRVFNAAGDVVPHAIEPRAKAPVGPGVAAELPFFPLYNNTGSGLDSLDVRIERTPTGTITHVTSGPEARGSAREIVAWLIDASSFEQPLHALDLDWRSDNEGRAHTLTIEASEDLATWTGVVRDAPVLKLEFGGRRLERKTVELDGRVHRYLRLSWARGADFLRLTRVKARAGESTLDPERAWKQVAPGREPARSGEYLFDSGGRFPVDQVKIDLPQDNTLASVELYSRATKDAEWHRVASSVAYRLRTDGREVGSPEVRLSVDRDRYLRLLVDQKGGGLGRGDPVLQIGWLPERLVFVARGEPPFQLAFGNARPQPAALGIATLVPGWGTPTEVAIMDAQIGAAEVKAGAAALAGRPNYRVWSLWTVLVLGVALLAWMAWRLTSQLKSAPRGPSPAPQDEPTDNA